MTLVTEIRKNVAESTPLMAMVGATDLAVERARTAAANAGHFTDEIEKAFAQLETVPKEWQAKIREIDAKTVQQAPVLAIHRAMEMATRVEESYAKLAERGKELLDRVGDSPSAQDLVKQGKVTLARTRAAMTTARKAVLDTVAAARGVITVGRREAREVVGAVEAEAADSMAATEKVFADRTRGTQAAVRGVASTVRRRAASTRTATRSVATSARKTARKAVEAVEAVAGQIGEEPAAVATLEAPGEAPAEEAKAGRRAVRKAKAAPAEAPAEAPAPVDPMA